MQSPPQRMCFSINPFAEWQIFENNKSEPISIFGMLPYPNSLPPPCSLVPFHFTSFEPTIMNSIVVGPNSMPCYEVKTEPDGVTMLMNAQGLPVSLIEWQYPPFVEIRDGL